MLTMFIAFIYYALGGANAKEILPYAAFQHLATRSKLVSLFPLRQDVLSVVPDFKPNPYRYPYLF